MAADHYFATKKVDKSALRPMRVRLAGRDVELLSAPGIFSPGHVDRGTRVLLDAVPKPPKEGHLLDLGCGWGPLALTMAMERPKATVWACDVNERALDLVARNAKILGLSNVRPVLPDDLDIPEFDAIWSNPPIRIGKDALHELLDHWLVRLGVGRDAFLVVQKNLGSDSLLGWLAVQNPDFLAERYASSKGFRVLRLHRLA